MELYGRIIELLPIIEMNGNKYQEIVIETEERNPAQLRVTIDPNTQTYNGLLTPNIWKEYWYNKVFQLGSMLSISFRLESIILNGKYYYELIAERIKIVEAG